MDSRHYRELHEQTSLHLFDAVKINQERMDTARKAFNQADATVFLSIGLHFTKDGKAYPVIVGTEWVTREQAILLCQEAMAALNPKILEDLQGKGGQP